MDGGVGNNNPADLAWNEADFMYSNGEQAHSGKVKALVSLGTGTAHAESRFGLTNLLRWSRRAITETTTAHKNVKRLAESSTAKYWRFDVKPENTVHDGLAGIRMDDCKRSRLRGRPVETDGAQLPTSSTNDGGQWHRNLQLEALEDDRKRTSRGWRTGYRPDKYKYDTFDKIYESTERYCTQSRVDDTDVEDAIDQCARFLYKAALNRWEDNHVRFRRFVSHPHPKHDEYLQHLPSEKTRDNEDEETMVNSDDDGDDSGVEGLAP